MAKPKSKMTHFIVNALATEIDLGAKASKPIRVLIAALAKEHGVVGERRH